MNDLIAWLRAQLDEDERIARAATTKSDPHWVVGTPIADQTIEMMEHAARHDPARVLREVEAKQLRLAETERELADDPTNETALWLLRVEVLPYADRPGYRAEWRPA